MLTTALLCLSGRSGKAQGVQHLSVAQPGGFPGLPIMTGIARATNGVTMTWDGPSGYYQLWHKTSLKSTNWVTVGKATNLLRITTVPIVNSNDFFRVSGPSPNYAGAQVCTTCHKTIHDSETNTPHAQALAALQAIHQNTNPNCLECHSVGYGLPTGFVYTNGTFLHTNLANVQCENCHGPAANHAVNPGDPTMVPRVELAGAVCGGCHSGAQHPTYEEWSGSPHAAVVPDVLENMSASTNTISSCGRCHSGSARVALLHGEDPRLTVANDYNVGITCGVCHDPHAQNVHTNVLNGIVRDPWSGLTFTNSEYGAVYTNQLRNPFASTNDFFLTISDVFSNKYNPSINVCAQCHNDQGASWSNTNRPPHHSPQYNILLGTADTNLPTYQFVAHTLLEQQCASCHMQTTDFVSEAQPAVTGHAFEMNSYALCSRCHSDAAGLVNFVTNAVTTQIQQTKSYLDLWATTTAPAPLQKYGTLAWEYITPGDLSSGNSGPDASEQLLIPDDIKKARFDLYLVLYDGSYGVHNGPYAIKLLQNAQALIEGQLYQ